MLIDREIVATIIFLIPKLNHLAHFFCTPVDNHMIGILYADDRVPTELKKAIMQARMDKKLTQSQLAQVFSPPNISLFMFFISSLHVINNNHGYLQIINEKPQVIQEYESGKAIPNQQIIGKLERALGAKLRGKK
jgi:putative transcription factor